MSFLATEAISTKGLPSCWPVFLYLLICCFLPVSLTAAEERPFTDRSASVSAEGVIPIALGETVYRVNEGSPNQVYIIGVSHRDTLTRLNGPTTVQAQVEVYRIAEWLIKNQGLELFLPEAFFGATADKIAVQNRSALAQTTDMVLDARTLAERLGDNGRHENAETLLSEHYAVKFRQVEDSDLYRAAVSKVRLLQKNVRDHISTLFIKAELDYLQQRRTASMLQNIPGIIDQEYAKGSIHKKTAVFTIGLAHIGEIKRYFEKKKITIPSPYFTSFEDYNSEVKLLNDYGVTIIIPKSLEIFANFFG